MLGILVRIRDHQISPAGVATICRLLRSASRRSSHFFLFFHDDPGWILCVVKNRVRCDKRLETQDSKHQESRVKAQTGLVRRLFLCYSLFRASQSALP